LVPSFRPRKGSKEEKFFYHKTFAKYRNSNPDPTTSTSRYPNKVQAPRLYE
ncbi:4580_t:CDS:1, partial [Gigaspora rosea]